MAFGYERAVKKAAARTGRKDAAKGIAPSPIISSVVGPKKTSKLTSKAQGTTRVKKALKRVQAASNSGTVSGPNIDAGEAKFYKTLAKKTGLSPSVLAAQGTQEGGADDDYNILNIGHTDSADTPITADERFKSPKKAAGLTAKFLKGKEGGASEGIKNIISSAGKSPDEQVDAIAGSGWATDPNYAEGIRRALPSIKEEPKKKVKKRDLKVLKKAGVSEESDSGGTPFAKSTSKSEGSKNAAKIIDPKWDDDNSSHGETFLAKGISPVVKKWSRKYNVEVGEAKADSGHVSPGHLQQGTATDLYPKEDSDKGWDELEKGLKVLENMGFEVGYGTNGVGQAWSNHGRNNHAHVEWVGQGSSPDAIKKLGGLTDAQISAIESSTGGGGPSGSSSGSGGSTGASGSASKGGNTRSEGKTVQKKLSRVRAAYSDSGTSTTSSPSGGTSLATLRRRYGKPTI